MRGELFATGFVFGLGACVAAARPILQRLKPGRIESLTVGAKAPTP